MSEIIDINISQTVEEVTIIATPTNYIVNINKIEAGSAVTSVNGLTGAVVIPIPDAQVNSDWNATSGKAQILNKPIISNLVPYIGANDNINIGTNDLYTKKVFLYDEVNDNHASIHYADGDFHIEDADGHKLLVLEDGFMQLHLSDIIQSNIWTTNLTQIRDHYLPNNSGTIALTSDITGINSGTNTGDETATTIKNKLGITTLSGNNTGDETTATIKNKLGFTPIKSIIKDTVQGSTITGVTTETLTGTYLIPANTFATNDIMKITSFLAEKIGTAGTCTMRVKVGTTNIFTTSTQIALYVFTNNYLTLNLQRFSIILRNSNLRTFTNTSQITDSSQNIVAYSNIAFNTTIDNYIFTSIQLSVATDSVFQSNFIMTN